VGEEEKKKRGNVLHMFLGSQLQFDGVTGGGLRWHVDVESEVVGVLDKYGAWIYVLI
jgi:hypothetical protein